MQVVAQKELRLRHFFRCQANCSTYSSMPERSRIAHSTAPGGISRLADFISEMFLQKACEMFDLLFGCGSFSWQITVVIQILLNLLSRK
jgi:hypothetical protein